MSASRDGIPSPSDLDLLGSKYNVAPYWLEEIALLLRTGASDAEILTQVQSTAGDDANSARTIPLTDEAIISLIAELKGL
jgi:hypothetical protein